MNSKPSLLHMIQAFLVEILQGVGEALPEGAQVHSIGRTIVSGAFKGQDFRVRLTFGKFEDDMWPHVEADISWGSQKISADFHPDLNADGHAEEIAAKISAFADA